MLAVKGPNLFAYNGFMDTDDNDFPAGPIPWLNALAWLCLVVAVIALAVWKLAEANNRKLDELLILAAINAGSAISVWVTSYFLQLLRSVVGLMRKLAASLHEVEHAQYKLVELVKQQTDGSKDSGNS